MTLQKNVFRLATLVKKREDVCYFTAFVAILSSSTVSYTLACTKFRVCSVLHIRYIEEVVTCIVLLE